MPVPIVSSRTTPGCPRPAPKAISASPAASASLMTTTGRPRRSVSSCWTGASMNPGSTLAALSERPSLITAGKPAPAFMSGVSQPPSVRRSQTRAVTSTTAVGVAGCGVFSRIRSETRRPSARSTTAPLMPVPPMSMPRARPSMSIGAGYVGPA